ncbi:MAG: twin-arginine translocation signal domain-containing protein, partial [Actinomycetota bacterium]|nr:twin-arginine translocation signal domain-containing protein [Actinomycetota bacterium]
MRRTTSGGRGGSVARDFSRRDFLRIGGAGLAGAALV